MRTKLIALATLFCSASAFAQTGKVDDALLMDYYQSQRYLDAADYLKKTFPEPINDIKALSRLAYTSRLAKRLPEAEAYYQRVYNMDSTDRAALFAIADINSSRGNQQNAEVFLKKILQKDSTNISVFTKLAVIAADKKDTVSAVSYLQKANKLNPADADVAVDLSAFYIKAKKFDLAHAALSKAAEGDPDNIFILATMVNLYYKEERFKETIEVGKRLISLDAAGKDVIYKMGVSYYMTGNFSCGAELLTSFTSLEQTEYSDYYAALCYKKLKDVNMSTYWFGEALKQGISGNVATYYAEIGDNNEKINKAKAALKAYQKALQFDDTNPQFYYAMALVYDKQLKDKANAKIYYKKAAAAFQEEVKIAPNPMTIYTLANLYDTELKDTANAIKFYKKYLSAKPPQKQQQFIAYTTSRIGQLGGSTD